REAHAGNAAATVRTPAVTEAATALALSPDIASPAWTEALPESALPALSFDALRMPAPFQTISAAVAAPRSRVSLAVVSPPAHRALPTLPNISSDVVDHFLDKPTWTFETAP